MNIIVENRQKDWPILKREIKPLVKEVIACEKLFFDEVSIYFVSEKEICRLHKEYFDDPSPTDCISFPLDADSSCGYKILGSVFVCPKTALIYASRHAKDPLTEITLYIIHGLLHLMGYDDIKKSDRLRMRKAEKRHLEHLAEKKLIITKKPNTH